MLNKLSLSKKIFGGFAIVLVLLVGIAYVGLNGLFDISDRVDNTDHVNKLVSGIATARQLEKEFMAQADRTIAEAVLGEIAIVREKIGEDKIEFEKTDADQKLPLVLQKVNAYERAFRELVDLEKQKDAALEQMRDKAKIALQQTETIREQQAQRLSEQRSKMAALTKEKRGKADMANRIIKWLLDARVAANMYIYEGYEPSRQELVDLVNQIITSTQEMQTATNSKIEAAMMTPIIDAGQYYLETFESFAELDQQQKIANADMVTSATELIVETQALHQVAADKLALLKLKEDTSVWELDVFQATVKDADSIINSVLNVRLTEKEFTTSQDIGLKEKLTSDLKKLKGFSRDMSFRFIDSEQRKRMGRITKKLDEYEKAFSEFAEYLTDKTAMHRQLIGIAGRLEQSAINLREIQNRGLSAARAESETFLDQKMAIADQASLIAKTLLNARHNEKDFILTGNAEYRSAVSKAAATILDLAKQLQTRDLSEDERQKVESVSEAVGAYSVAFEHFADRWLEQQNARQLMFQAARDAQSVFENAGADQRKKMKSQINRSRSVMLSGTVIAIIAGILLALVTTRRITKPLVQAITGLTGSADQVTQAADQVSSSSQSLAEGASNQAASIEETSSSLEEMSSMTKANADNAFQADRIMKGADTVVSEANASILELTASMEGITKASDETSKIIKTIDEIAFQTNLLALNAAVEAARAGEAGAGFAVVADEVRNLAIRAADAAGITADLIEGTVKKVAEGTGLLNRTNEAFEKVAQSADKVSTLVGEISAASSEQAEGIKHVNTAVTEMDRVVQQNAAHSEESASAAEEMNAQAKYMQGIINDLGALIGNLKQENATDVGEDQVDTQKLDLPPEKLPAPDEV